MVKFETAEAKISRFSVYTCSMSRAPKKNNNLQSPHCNSTASFIWHKDIIQFSKTKGVSMPEVSDNSTSSPLPHTFLMTEFEGAASDIFLLQEVRVSRTSLSSSPFFILYTVLSFCVYECVRHSERLSESVHHYLHCLAPDVRSGPLRRIAWFCVTSWQVLSDIRLFYPSIYLNNYDISLLVMTGGFSPFIRVWPFGTAILLSKVIGWRIIQTSLFSSIPTPPLVFFVKSQLFKIGRMHF